MIRFKDSIIKNHDANLEWVHREKNGAQIKISDWRLRIVLSFMIGVCQIKLSYLAGFVFKAPFSSDGVSTRCLLKP